MSKITKELLQILHFKIKLLNYIVNSFIKQLLYFDKLSYVIISHAMMTCYRYPKYGYIYSSPEICPIHSHCLIAALKLCVTSPFPCAPPSFQKLLFYSALMNPVIFKSHISVA